jgi:hypothetical protein
MSNIVKSAKKIVEDNNLSDKIEIIQGKVEEITLPVDKVRKYSNIQIFELGSTTFFFGFGYGFW